MKNTDDLITVCEKLWSFSKPESP